MSTVSAIANLAWLASNVPGWLRFRAALQAPRTTQLKLLRNYLRENGATAYGRAHGLEGIRSYEEFQRHVPCATYDDLEPWITRIRDGEANVLTRDPVTHLIPTSGSTAARKLIPFTTNLQREFNRAIGPWIADLYAAHPSLALGSAYWAITPVAQCVSPENSAVPIGFDDDASYLGGVRKKLANAVMAVPAAVRLIGDIETFRYVTLLCLLRRRDLALISVWHPSFLTLLLDALPRHWDSLLADIESGGCRLELSENVTRALSLPRLPARAAELRAASPLIPSLLWPALSVISCWGDAHAALALHELRQRFPQTCLQPKGLLATEAFVTIPFAGAWPLAIRSHFCEFVDERGQMLLSDELRPGGEYEVVVTTAAGLWRYRLGDLVRVTGFVGDTPSLRFLGRTHGGSDRFGEKLSEAFVGEVIRELLETQGVTTPFAMLAPDEVRAGACYTLYAQTSATIDGGKLDALLRRNPHYDYCRRLGQLQRARVFRVAVDGYENFAGYERANGRRLGEIKPCALSPADGWSVRFVGGYEGVTFDASTQSAAV